MSFNALQSFRIKYSRALQEGQIRFQLATQI